LRRNGLVVETETQGTSRRQFLGKWGKVAVAVPVISSLTMKPAAAQLSCISDCMAIQGDIPNLCGQTPCNSGSNDCATSTCFVNYLIAGDSIDVLGIPFVCADEIATGADQDCNVAKAFACFANTG